ncbi:NAD(P)H-dependent flavin oxidoreductase [Haloimpatiens lingqiaonensis]|uniref:NAD(P)H-dependent flavin oxidoreductase n=1 Tax=Haloimpatiens lingqiaonensis TaxID=1380675 RepID=UPI0010FDD2F5|nr:nitronate monooxygenase family protein [Haloimpatiens lingqiaonensis]
MKLPSLIIGNLKAKLPIIQGGMGIGISLSGLASAVAREGGIGIISGVGIGFRESDFSVNSKEANIRALKKEIVKAKTLSSNGIIGVNILTASNEYEELVTTASQCEADLIICGAGLPTNLPALVKNKITKLIPIVSSGKAASIITKLWKRKYNYIPDALIVEGPKAGGHLGFSKEDLFREDKKLENILEEVIKAIKPFEEEAKRSIPIIAAGGIFHGSDIPKFLKLGASGVQMGTRFVATEECDAHIKFKRAYINSKKEDLDIVISPVGMPGRAIKNSFINSIKNENLPIDKCYRCLSHCNPKTAPYCISKALINSANGNLDEGLIFCGENAYRLKEIVPVKDLIQTLLIEAEEN